MHFSNNFETIGDHLLYDTLYRDWRETMVWQPRPDHLTVIIIGYKYSQQQHFLNIITYKLWKSYNLLVVGYIRVK